MVRKPKPAAMKVTPAVPDDETWVTKDGRVLRVAQMDEDHVRNALRMVLRGLRRTRERVALQRQLNRLRDELDMQWDEERSWGRS